MERWGLTSSNIRRVLVCASLSHLLLFGSSIDAKALTYVKAPVWTTFDEAANADDQSLAAGDRLARLSHLVAAIESAAAEVQQQNAAIDSASAEGDSLTGKIHETLAQLQLAVNSATVRAATGNVEQHGLGWLCNHIRSLPTDFERQSSAIATAASPFRGALAAIPVGDPNAVARIGGLAAAINASIHAKIGGKEVQDVKAQLDLITSELPYAWGTYTTLSQMASEVEVDGQRLNNRATTLSDAAKLAVPYRQYLRWRDAFLATSHVLQTAPGVDLGALKALYARVNGAIAIPSTVDIDVRARDADSTALKFRKVVEDAIHEVDEKMRPIRREYAGGVEQAELPEPGAAVTATGCVGMKDAVSELRDIRLKGGKTMRHGLDGLKEAIAERDSSIAGAIKSAADTVARETQTIEILDKKLATLRQGRAVANSQLRAKFDDTISKANAIRVKSTLNRDRTEKAILGLSQESAAVERLKQSIEALAALAESSMGS